MKIHTTITLPGSKSITNRALIIAALAKGESILNNVLFSDDTLTCMNALKTLGVLIEWDEQKLQCRIVGTGGIFSIQDTPILQNMGVLDQKNEPGHPCFASPIQSSIQDTHIWCQDSGTVARFLFAACAGSPTNECYHFSGSPQLQSRPIAALVNALKSQGVKIYSTQDTHANQDIHISQNMDVPDHASQKMDVLNQKNEPATKLDSHVSGHVSDSSNSGQSCFGHSTTPTTSDSHLSKSGPPILDAILDTHLPLTIIKNNNRLKGGNLFVDSHESSQFISALLMIAPYAQTSMTISTELSISEPYVQLTCQMMEEFGVPVTLVDSNAQNSSNEISSNNNKNRTSYSIHAPQCYQGGTYDIEPDLSTASYFFAAAAVTGGKITIENINRNTCKQGDIAFLDILERMGCIISNADNHSQNSNSANSDNKITVQGPKQLKGLTVDMSAISDTMMTLACIAPFADSPTTITNIAHVRHKESDRIAAVVNNLKKLGIETLIEKQANSESITIFPMARKTPKTAIIDSYNDHRVAMAFSLIALHNPDISINNKECVSKTCPNFFDLWEKMLS